MSLKAFIFIYCLLSHLRKSSFLFRFHRLRYKAKWCLCSAALSDLSPQNHSQTFSYEKRMVGLYLSLEQSPHMQDVDCYIF